MLLPIHDGADCGHFVLALESISRQSTKDFEVLLLVDGPVRTELADTIKQSHLYFEHGKLAIIHFETNRGLGPVLNDGLQAATGKYVARMDADDICEPNRFKLQLDFLEANPDVDVLGSNMLEFVETPSNIIFEKRMPNDHEQILRYAKMRNPINHPTAFFRRQVAIDSGGYRDLPFFEDYDLWLRLLAGGSKFRNLQTALLRYRLSSAFYERRRGIAYVVHQYRFLRAARETGFITIWGQYRWILLRSLPFLLPAQAHKWLYKRLRSS